jgi:hypothetical protein
MNCYGAYVAPTIISVHNGVCLCMGGCHEVWALFIYLSIYDLFQNGGNLRLCISVICDCLINECTKII